MSNNVFDDLAEINKAAGREDMEAVNVDEVVE